MTNGTDGGVLHLLRLTRTQCHAWVAFVALRGEDGSIDIIAVPGPDDEGSEWTLETLEGIVRQTLQDPLIGEGRAVIRVSEVFRRYWPGERQYTRMAVAPLNDVSEPGRPWGLLCALDPVDGQFSEAQLDMLGRLAVRFLNHLRVRRQFVDDAAASEALLTAAMSQETPANPETGPEEGAASPPDEGIVRIERTADWLTRQEETVEPEERRAQEPEPQPEPPGEHGGVEVVFGQAFSVGVAPAGGQEQEGGAAEVTGSEDEPPAAEVPDEPSGAVRTAVAEEPRAGAFRRVRLSELIDQLEQTLSRLRTAQRRGALFLVEIETGRQAAGEGELEAAAGRLAEATRHTDLVLGVGSDMLAVVMELGPRPASLEAIRERLRSASGFDVDEGGGLRASAVSLEPDESSNGEALLLAAVRQLGAR